MERVMIVIGYILVVKKMVYFISHVPIDLFLFVMSVLPIYCLGKYHKTDT